jgi:hypothetical protein
MDLLRDVDLNLPLEKIGEQSIYLGVGVKKQLQKLGADIIKVDCFCCSIRCKKVWFMIVGEKLFSNGIFALSDKNSNICRKIAETMCVNFANYREMDLNLILLAFPPNAPQNEQKMIRTLFKLLN